MSEFPETPARADASAAAASTQSTPSAPGTPAPRPLRAIQPLPDQLISQIAAGEVVERPASVVKELLENALDAGAQTLRIMLDEGGVKRISITDDGCGIPENELALALMRHATSKIRSLAELEAVATLGFRGEALASIASVAQMTITSRTADAPHAMRVDAQTGVLSPAAGTQGTTIEVRELYFNTPARRKFLKSEQTELGHCLEQIRRAALARPDVAISVLHNGKAVEHWNASEPPVRVAKILGETFATAHLPLDESAGPLAVYGCAGLPTASRGRSDQQYFFVNGRFVRDKLLTHAVRAAYEDVLHGDRYPSYVLFLDLPPEAVDVNVHPSKREVRFRSETAVRGFIIRSVLHRLRELSDVAGPVPVLQQVDVTPPPFATPPTVVLPKLVAVPPASIERRVSDNTPHLPTPTSAPAAPIIRPSSLDIRHSRSPEPVPAPATPAWRFLGLAHGAYALFETRAGLVLLDRRAAHERIWFERLQQQFSDGTVPSQRLLLPLPMELDPIASALLLDRLEFLNGHGFGVVEFGRNFFRIEGVPAWMEPADAEPFVRELLGALRDGRLQERRLDVAREQLARLAAARAVRLGEVANESAMLALVAQLFACRSPLTSPGGTPTHVELSHGELARRFQR